MKFRIFKSSVGCKNCVGAVVGLVHLSNPLGVRCAGGADAPTAMMSSDGVCPCDAVRGVLNRGVRTAAVLMRGVFLLDSPSYGVRGVRTSAEAAKSTWCCARSSTPLSHACCAITTLSQIISMRRDKKRSFFCN